jgi:small GTP-binding protein
MGGYFSSVTSFFVPPKPLAVMCVGLDNAGKTTLFRALTFDPDHPGAALRAPPNPTVGFNTETFRIGPHEVTMWDLGGQERLRKLWDNYFAMDVDALVFVVDGTDTEARLNTAKGELHNVLRLDSVVKPLGTGSARTHDASILILVNKSDKADCLSALELEERWDVRGMIMNAVSDKRGTDGAMPQWQCRACAAISGTGVQDTMAWVVQAAAETRA